MGSFLEESRIALLQEEGQRGRFEGLLASWLEGKPTTLNIDDRENQGMGKVRKDFFARNAEIVARDLLGRTLRVNLEGIERQVRISEVGAYEGATKRTSEGALYEPGIVSVSFKFGQCLVDIATGKEDKKKASCVTLRAGYVGVTDGELFVEGPGNLAKNLGITRATKEMVQGIKAYGRSLWIEGDAVPHTTVEIKKGNSPNCRGFYFFKASERQL